MAVIAIRVPDNEYKYAEQLANFKGVKLSTYFRNLLAEQIEDFEDEQILKEMEEKYSDDKNVMRIVDFIKSLFVC